MIRILYEGTAVLNKLRKNNYIASFLITSILFLSIQPAANAAIVSTSDLLIEEQSTFDRQSLLKSFDRKEVQTVLVSKGVDVEMAKLRVASMTNEEVRLLNAKIDQLPAGSGIHGTIGFILVVLLITDLIGVTDVYSFIN